MNAPAQWLLDLEIDSKKALVEGLVPVSECINNGRSPEEIAVLEKAKSFGAHSVFFEAGRHGRPPVAQAFIFVSDGSGNDKEFAELHRRLWSWGGVPLVYRKTPGRIQLFRCAHKPDFISSNGEMVCNPIKTLKIASAISNSDAWWDASRLRNGTLWDEPEACKKFLSSTNAAHRQLIEAVKQLNTELNNKKLLPKSLRRKLLILSLLIAYLEERKVFPEGYFEQFHLGATKFFHVLAHGMALIELLKDLEKRFNGNVFVLDDDERDSLVTNKQLAQYARFIEGREEKGGQRTLWRLYSFEDLPVELISHIYQHFVEDGDSSIYTPPFLVRLILEEALSWERIDRLMESEKSEIILDPCCGSGVFLVEAYKRLVLHWRSRNQWKKPRTDDLRKLITRVHGIDREKSAVKLAAFSLYLALCDSLEPEAIRKSVRLFPPLEGETLHEACFFDAKSKGLIKQPVGVVVGNPPFKSKLDTEGAQRSYEKYQEKHGSLPDKQLAYLFLNDAMEMVAPGGVLSMLQQYNFLYNQNSLEFRRNFITHWNVREILDFISVRGLFQKGKADTKVLVVVAEANAPKNDRKILHAVFRRSGRADAEQGFDIDYYDMHWLPRNLALNNDGVWRADLLGGGRVMDFIGNLSDKHYTIDKYAKEQEWDFGEGFIYGNPENSRPSNHVVGKPYLPAKGLMENRINSLMISIVPEIPIERPRREEIYTPPLLIIHKTISLNHCFWNADYLTYSHELFGFSASKKGKQNLENFYKWFTSTKKILQAYILCHSYSLLSSRATAILSSDILSLPYPKSGNLDISENEQILVDDIVDYYRDFIRLGESSAVMKESGLNALPDFSNVFTKQINSIYKKNPLRTLEPQTWPGIVCQPFVFGKGKVDWSGADELKDKLNSLLREQRGASIHITRIARIYDGPFIFLLKPDRLRYWLRSIALRDADETLADLWEQGF